MAGVGSGKIPEYKPEDVSRWLGAQSDNVSNLVQVALWCVPVLGFILMMAGFWQVAKESREAALGGGGGKRYGWWMVLGGGGVASAGTLLVLLAGFLRPPGS